MFAFGLLGIIIIIGLCAFYRAPRLVWTLSIGAVLLGYSISAALPIGLLVFSWILFLAIVGIVYLPATLRSHYLTRHLFIKFRNKIPPISETERIALEAGDVWWEGELFSGQPRWQTLFDLAAPSLTATEQAFLNQQVETLCQMLNDWEIVQENGDLPPAVWDYIKAERFLGLVIAPQYGGHGFSAYAHSCIITKIASRSVSAAITIMVPNSLGPAELLQHYGTASQKDYYLPRLARGVEIPCFALTAPTAGSDAAGMLDTGIICRDVFEDHEVIGIRLNWDKRYITLAPLATVLGLAFKLYDPDHLLSEHTELGITLVLIPTQHPGVEIGARHWPLHMAFSNGPTRGKDVFIPLDWVIGGPAMCGKGWHMLMESLAVGRGISLPALGTGMSQLCLRTTGAYARLRQQFKVSLGQFEGIQEALARIGGFTYLCEATRLLTATAVASGIKPSLASAIAKYHITELSRRVVNDGMDIHGGKTIQLGPHNYLGFYYEALPISITVEGANILTRNLIIFGQGVLRCHPFLRQALDAVQQTDSPHALQRFDQLLLTHVGQFASNSTRLLAYGVTGGRWVKTPHNMPKSLRYYARQLTRLSMALAVTVDVTLLAIGKELKRRERLSARLGDVVSYLYLASAVLWYHRQVSQDEQDLPLVQWSLDWCLYRIQNALEGLFDNFPNRLGRLLRTLVFPWGRAYRPPADRLGQQIALALQQPSATRDRLTRYCYLGQGSKDIISVMEQALQLATQLEPIQQKLQQAIRNKQLVNHPTLSKQLNATLDLGILTAAEVKLWQQFETLRAAIIAVDEFSPETFTRKTSHANSSNTL